LSAASIRFTYSGVRPLAYTSDIDEQSITRRHFIRDHAPQLEGLISIVGGKLTTYRSLAAAAVDLAFKKLGRGSRDCTTNQVPLPGAVTPDFAAFSDQFKIESRLPRGINERLLRIYGTRAPGVLKLAAEDPALANVFSPTASAIAAEVVFSFKHEL